VRQNTFTKDSASPVVRPATTEESKARLVTSAGSGKTVAISAFSQDRVSLVGGRIVRRKSAAGDQKTAITKMSPGAIRKQSGSQLHTDGDLQFETTTGSEYVEVSADRPKLVRRRTWTKLDGEQVFKSQQQEDYNVSMQTKGERYESRKHSDNLKIEGQFQGKRDNAIIVGSGERSTITKHKDNLKLEGEFIRKVPDKWEPGQRAAVIKQRDNLVPPGPVEDNRDKGPIGKGERAPITKHGDNLKPEGDFEKRSIEEYKSSQKATAVKHMDHLTLEGEFELPEAKAWAPGERSAVIK